MNTSPKQRVLFPKSIFNPYSIKLQRLGRSKSTLSICNCNRLKIYCRLTFFFISDNLVACRFFIYFFLLKMWFFFNSPSFEIKFTTLQFSYGLKRKTHRSIFRWARRVPIDHRKTRDASDSSARGVGTSLLFKYIFCPT